MKDRLLILKEFIEKNGKVTLRELECAFPDVSSMTLRRDLVRLEDDNAIIRTPGGAVSVDSVIRAKEAELAERINYTLRKNLKLPIKQLN